MAQHKGRDFTLKVNTVSSGGLVLVAGLRTKSLTINNETVDTSNATHGIYRRLLEGAGIQSMSVSANGIFEDDTALGLIRGYAIDATHQTYRLTFGDGSTFEGEFQVSSFGFAGEHNGAQTYDISLESSGQIVYTDA